MKSRLPIGSSDVSDVLIERISTWFIDRLAISVNV